MACVGESVATHAEYNAVPRNLVALVPATREPGSRERDCAVGAIALQSIRQAKLELGESVAIIGLGLLGQFLVQLCRANGCRVIGVDLDPGKCALAEQNGAEAACPPEMPTRPCTTLCARAAGSVRTRCCSPCRPGISLPIELAASAGARSRPGGLPRQHHHRAGLAHVVRQGNRFPVQPRDGGRHQRSGLLHVAAGTIRSATCGGRPTGTCRPFSI